MIWIQPTENRAILPDIKLDPPEALALKHQTSKVVLHNNILSLLVIEKHMWHVNSAG